jgi:hypothetical protein
MDLQDTVNAALDAAQSALDALETLQDALFDLSEVNENIGRELLVVGNERMQRVEKLVVIRGQR